MQVAKLQSIDDAIKLNGVVCKCVIVGKMIRRLEKTEAKK